MKINVESSCDAAGSNSMISVSVDDINGNDKSGNEKKYKKSELVSPV